MNSFNFELQARYQALFYLEEENNEKVKYYSISNRDVGN
jgi:hypothetical protein